MITSCEHGFKAGFFGYPLLRLTCIFGTGGGGGDDGSGLNGPEFRSEVVRILLLPGGTTAGDEEDF